MGCLGGPNPSVFFCFCIFSGAAALYPSTNSSAALGGFRVFGGLNTVGDTLPSSFLSDGGAYDAATQQWAPIADAQGPTEAGLGPRAYASVAHLPGGSLLFGGFAGAFEILA